MKHIVNQYLKKIPYIKKLVRQHNKKVMRLEEKIRSLEEQVKKQGIYPAGHYYSPIPDAEDVCLYVASRNGIDIDLLDIDLNKISQFELLQKYVEFYEELPFPEKQSLDCRYYYDQDWFCYADAIFLYSFLRKNKPKRIVEVGSGFSSAVILDTIERFLAKDTEVTFIEPYPDRLKSLLREEDNDKYQILENRIQDIPLEVFTSLQSGDLLFVDSSHVLKCGSDLQLLLFDILPRLPVGVYVHFHDIFYPFEYPDEWLTGGRYWNEDYFLRSFLAYNNEWKIYFFNTYVTSEFNNFFKENMPLCLKNPGGSLYIQRIDKK